MITSADVAYVVVESLASARGPMSMKELLEEAPFPRASVAGVLAVLTAIGATEKNVSPSGEGADYSLRRQLSAYQIAKVAELGVDLGALGKWLGLSEKQKQAAMALATQAEKLKELDDELRAKRVAERSKPVDALPRDAIVETLERLAEASSVSLEDCEKSGAPQEIVLALQEAREQALKALREYQDELGKSAHVGF